MRLNNAVASELPALLAQSSVALVAGRAQYAELRARVGEDTPKFQLHDFVSNMHEFMAASDIVVSRAGMAALSELAALARPVVLVPNAQLTGGHQTKNAAVYADADAIVVVDEVALAAGKLGGVVGELLASSERRQELSHRIHQFARPHAARDVAKLILKAK